MISSYTNFIKLHNLRILLLVIFLGGCQLDQSVNIIKEKIFSTEPIENNKQESVKDISNVDELENKKSNSDINVKTGRSDDKLFISPEKEESASLEIDQDSNSKLSEDTFISKRGKGSNNELAFKELGKARDEESKIISFFNKIFDNIEDTLEPKSDISKKLGIEKKQASENFFISDQEDSTKESVELISEDDENIYIKEMQENEEKLDQYLDGSKVSRADNVNPGFQSNVLNEEDNMAFLSPEVKNDSRKETLKSDNLVGLLLPLTGPKSAAGDLVINSLRYSMLQKSTSLNFKIFDTKGTPKGALNASKQAVRSGIKTFIGPIFSDETRKVKEFFKNRRQLTFFSLSPDLNNVSNNVIVSGQNPEDQMACITKHISQSDSENILIVYHADKYGYVIRDSFKKFLEDFGVSNYASLQLFEIDSDVNLNNKVKELSRFDERKKELNEEIQKIKDDANLELSLKNTKIKKLERMLTLTSPFDSIVIASEGDKLLEILSHFAFYDINSENSNIYGTSLWEDTDKDDMVFKGSIFASSLKKTNNEFEKSFRSVFSKAPMAFNFHMHDLLDLVQNYKIFDSKKRRAVFYGEFSNSKINSGLLNREIFLKKIKKNRGEEEIFNCRLDEI